MQKKCERCGTTFGCNTKDIVNCDCSKVKITTATRQQIIQLGYKDCLCNNCLTELQNKHQPKKTPTFIKGQDYYIENGLYVFTEYYLKSRGYCCKSGCRHCPYGYRK